MVVGVGILRKTVMGWKKGKRQEARGMRQEARGMRQEAWGKSQEAREKLVPDIGCCICLRKGNMGSLPPRRTRQRRNDKLGVTYGGRQTVWGAAYCVGGSFRLGGIKFRLRHLAEWQTVWGVAYCVGGLLRQFAIARVLRLGWYNFVCDIPRNGRVFLDNT